MANKIKKKSYSISIYLDKQREKKNGKYPVKLKVYLSKTRIRKYYPTEFELTPDEFNDAFTLSKQKGLSRELKEIREKLDNLKEAAKEIADDLPYFSIDLFENKLNEGTVSAEKNLAYYYKKKIDQMKSQRSFVTASLYQQSLDSLTHFNGGKSPNFEQITSEWLKKYELWMQDSPNNKSITTVSIYIRNLRTVFGRALNDKTIPFELYPFGKGIYMIPEKSGIKHALKRDDIRKLLKGKPANEYQQKAKDFWFFSFFGNGMNIKDIAYLRWKDVHGDRISFLRKKPGSTIAKQAPVSICLNDFTRKVLKKYAKASDDQNDFVFEIIDKEIAPEEQERKKTNFVRYITQHMKKYAEQLGVEKINVKIARNSFATTAILKGQSMEFAQEALGHRNIKTTQLYFAGFEDEIKKEFTQKMMDL